MHLQRAMSRPRNDKSVIIVLPQQLGLRHVHGDLVVQDVGGNHHFVVILVVAEVLQLEVSGVLV